MSKGNGKAPDPVEAGVEAAVQHPAVQRVVQAALAGELQRARPLKYWEPDLLNEVHLQMILMRAAGFRQREIAERLDVTESNVSVALNHPDAQTILSVLVSHAADTVLDVRTRMKAHAGEMLDNLVTLARETKDHNVRARVAFGLLDRAGYGQKHEAKVTHELTVSADALARLEKALDMSGSLDANDEVWAPYVIEDGRQGSGSSVPALPSGGQAPDEAKPPRVGSPQMDSEEAA